MVKAQKPLHKTAMSFLTAISLSFSNLLTKKGRTIMTAVAGSIGIIGIAAILALANGVNNYINTTEEDTLSLYPLQIASSTVDLGTLLTGGSSSGSQDSVGNPATQTIGERSSLSQMFSSVSSNDLKALKSYLATNPDNVNSHLTTTEYQYDVNPLIYANSVTKGKRDVRQINPSTTFQSLGIGVSGTFAGSLQQSMVANTFSQLAADQGLYSAKYKVLDGHWPTAANQVVMVVTSKGETSDYMLYQMGLRDPDQLSSMVRKLAQGDKNIKVPKDKRTYSYQDLMNVSFKLVNPAATYRYNKSYQLWEDRSTDKSFMRKLLAKAETLHIVGIVEPTDAS
ncbi:MAG: ABC transporter, partial [Coriobacteriales bacterium]|nr:ABC transporter [Coriobacteriales bacterium]